MLVATAAAAGLIGGVGWPALIERLSAPQRGSLLGWSGLGALVGVCIVQWLFPVSGLGALQITAGLLALATVVLAARLR
jgi:hypothetical protein